MDETPDRAGVARAARLRRRIEELKASREAEPGEAEPVAGESPREFVHRRMREIAEAERGEQAEPER
jgi:hypothetical protein